MTAPTYMVTVIDGECVPTQLPINDTITIGRDPNCDLRILDDRASRFHARLQIEQHKVVLHDLNSSNGSYYNDKRITEPTVLKAGSLFSCGGVQFALLNNSGKGDDTQTITDKGQVLNISTQQPTRFWTSGDAPDELALIHTILNSWHKAGSQDAPKALTTMMSQQLGCKQSAIVLGGRVVGGGITRRLALRLAHGTQARLLRLGHELSGHTIAAAAIGSAVTAPIGDAGYLVLARGVEDELLTTKELRVTAAVAAELTPLLSKEASVTDGIIGQSEIINNLRRRIERVASTDATVLITGESGTGKELVARALHQQSGRAHGPFVAINCAAISAELFEAELFGHEAGAFTGAHVARPGRFRQAHGGTLFLDEIGELPETLQPKLLRALQEGVIEPVGGSAPIEVDVRIVTATNRHLQAEVDAGRFRADLFYRLDVVRLTTPALRDHSDDIPLLAEHLLHKAAQETGLLPLSLTADAKACLQKAPWPGNVRQLSNVLTRALISATKSITAADLDLHPEQHHTISDTKKDAVFPTLAQVEAAHVAAALARCGGNRSQAAQLLGISRPTVLKKIADYGLE